MSWAKKHCHRYACAFLPFFFPFDVIVFDRTWWGGRLEADALFRYTGKLARRERVDLTVPAS